MTFVMESTAPWFWVAVSHRLARLSNHTVNAQLISRSSSDRAPCCRVLTMIKRRLSFVPFLVPRSLLPFHQQKMSSAYAASPLCGFCLFVSARFVVVVVYLLVWFCLVLLLLFLFGLGFVWCWFWWCVDILFIFYWGGWGGVQREAISAMYHPVVQVNATVCDSNLCCCVLCYKCDVSRIYYVPLFVEYV